MQEGNKKKKWGKPKLLILTRGKPEEAVLMVCKAETAWGSGPDKSNSKCWLKAYVSETGAGFGDCVRICSQQVNS
jgi:hypothetical protein